jgi:3-hydroxy-9,10-secoandrosta-1,3,5(10)-triene-9,17-dione monooxygenase
VTALTDRSEKTPTTGQLVARAAEWVPTLRARSQHTEELRRIPDETVAEFRERELHLTAQSPEHGGFGLGIDAVAEVAFEVGRGCCSTAWMAGQWPGHQFMVCAFGREAQDEYFGTSGPGTFSSTGSAPVNLTVDAVKGGLEVSGQIRFSSGCDHAEWILLMAGGCLNLVPKSDFQILDDWHVMGLRGTGSKSVLFDHAIIPAHRTVPMGLIGAGEAPGTELWDDPYLRGPFSLSLNTMLLTPVIGMAGGLVELFEERALKRIDGHNGQLAYTRPGVQLRFAEATAEVDAARLVTRNLLAELRHFGEAGGPIPALDRARLRRDIVYAAKLCVQAADRLLESGDASGMFDAQLVQRWGRDIHMGALQFVLTWDEPAMSYAQARWGLPVQSVMSS